MKEYYGVIYKITNKINKKVYIGQTTRGFKKRYNNRWWHYTSNDHLKRSAEKYGESNFDVIELFDIAYSKCELDEKEKYWIGHYESNNSEKGFNLDDGGSNGLPNEIAKKKMSLAKKGQNNNRYGVKLSKETKERISKSNKGKQSGEKHPLYGKHHSEKWRKEHSERMKGKNHPSFGLLGSDNPKARKVICITTNKIFGSIKEAMGFYNYKSRSKICDCCKGKVKSAGKDPNTGQKLSWMYLEDYEEYIKQAN